MAVNLGFRIFYEHDVKPVVSNMYREVRGTYVGPGWRHINGYERLGRVVAGTLLLGLWIAMWLLIAGLVFGFISLVASWVL